MLYFPSNVHTSNPLWSLPPHFTQLYIVHFTVETSPGHSAVYSTLYRRDRPTSLSCIWYILQLRPPHFTQLYTVHFKVETARVNSAVYSTLPSRPPHFTQLYIVHFKVETAPVNSAVYSTLYRRDRPTSLSCI